jgi:hypothetical protein
MTGFAGHSQLEFLIGGAKILAPSAVAGETALALRHIESEDPTHLFSQVILKHFICLGMSIVFVPGMKLGQINKVYEAKFLVGGIKLTGLGLSIVTEDALSDTEVIRFLLHRGGNSAIVGLRRVCPWRGENYQSAEQDEQDDGT